MRTQRTAKGNPDAGSSCSCDRGLYRYLQNFGGVEPPPPQTPPWYATGWMPCQGKRFIQLTRFMRTLNNNLTEAGQP